MPRATLPAASTALVAVVFGVSLSGSIGSFLIFAAGLALFVAPGIPIARLWFTGGEALLAGAGLGYFLSSLVASALYRWELFGAVPVAVVCGALWLGLELGLRPKGPRGAGPAPPEGRGWFAGAFLLVIALVALPFLRVGESSPEGLAYRAYFGADLMTHLSVVGELQKQEFPPQNPFYAGLPLGYYWLFFLFPALVGKWIGNQEAIFLTYVAGGLLFAGLAFAAVRRLTSSSRLAFVAVLAGLAAASFEGLAILARAVWLGEPLGSFKNMNVDAFSRWVLELTSLDGLHRSLLYTPQHLFSYSLLLILILLVIRGEPRGSGSSLLAGGLLGGMAGTSIVTAMLAGPWLVLVRLIRGGPFRAIVWDLTGFGAVSVAALAWYFGLGFFGEAGAELALRRPQLLEVPALIFLECGPLVLLSITAWTVERARPLGYLAAVALLAVLFLDLRSWEGLWMAWRAGSVLLVALLLAAGIGMAKWPRAAVAAVLVPASLTAILDLYNAQDVTNRETSAGEFRWTTVIRHAELEALRWIRSETPPRSVVQWDTRAREPGEWALIPAVAERRMAVGFPIFLLDLRKYRARERRQIRPIFTSDDAAEAHRLAVEGGIDYLYVGRQEVSVRGERLRKLWEAPDLFREVYSNREVTVFEVRR